MLRLYLAVPFSTTRFLLRFLQKQKTGMLGHTCLNILDIKKKRPSEFNKQYLMTMLASLRYLVSHVAVWFSVWNACFGREKEASELASEASAELIRFSDLACAWSLASRLHGRTSTSWSHWL